MVLGRGEAPKLKSEAKTPTLMLDSRNSLHGNEYGEPHHHDESALREYHDGSGGEGGFHLIWLCKRRN